MWQEAHLFGRKDICLALRISVWYQFVSIDASLIPQCKGANQSVGMIQVWVLDWYQQLFVGRVVLYSLYVEPDRML